MHGQQNIKLFLCVLCDFSTYIFGELVYVLYIYILLFIQHNGDVSPEKNVAAFPYSYWATLRECL
jgi:phage-related holin